MKSSFDNNDGPWLDLGFDSAHLSDERDINDAFLETAMNDVSSPGFYKIASSYTVKLTTFEAKSPTTV